MGFAAVNALPTPNQFRIHIALFDNQVVVRRSWVFCWEASYHCGQTYYKDNFSKNVLGELLRNSFKSWSHQIVGSRIIFVILWLSAGVWITTRTMAGISFVTITKRISKHCYTELFSNICGWNGTEVVLPRTSSRHACSGRLTGFNYF